MSEINKKPTPTEQKTVRKIKKFLSKHQKGLLTTFFIVFFFLTFIISVSGGLRVFFPYIGDLTGFPIGHRSYLLIFQNNNEIRPAGGFISSFGLLEMTAGVPTKIQIEDVYGDIDEHDYLTPPYPMEDLLANEWYKGYSFRDGNYSPDFPASAEELIRLYHLTRPEQELDGVIAVNFRVLENLLDTLGPLEVEGRWLSKDNLFEELTNQVNDVDRHNLSSLDTRKSVLKPLADAVIKKILFNPFKLRKVSDVITRSLSAKDIQLYFNDPALQNLVTDMNWAGAWPQTVEGDLLAIVEANLGGMKSDRYIERNVTYHLRFDEDFFNENAEPKAQVDIDLFHYGIENIPLSGPYTGYFRFYHQLESLQSAFATNPANANINRPLEELVELVPGQTTTVTKTYSVSRDVVKDNIYSLYIPKQAGTSGDMYTVIIELPRGYRVESDDFESRENFGFWQGHLNRDVSLQLKILPDQLPPRVVLQQNIELNHFSVHFNEDLNQSYAEDPFSYEVIDLDQINPDKTDNIFITKIEATSKDVHIYTRGQTNQPEERYGLRLKNLRDIHGNVLSDRQITLVQRLK